jgi:hypothetical protein
VIDFEEIKRRVTIEDILIDCGYNPRKNRMACPLHDGNNPTSFSFTDHAYHCFSCGAAGGLLDLAQALLKVNRAEALKYLASKAHLDLVENDLGNFRSNFKPIMRMPFEDGKYKIRELELDLKELDVLMDYYTWRARNARKRLRNGEIYLPEYYSTTQYAEYVLEELDTKIALGKYRISAEKKKLRKSRKIGVL